MEAFWSACHCNFCEKQMVIRLEETEVFAYQFISMKAMVNRGIDYHFSW